MSHEPSGDAVDDDVLPATLERRAPDDGTADTAVVATRDDGPHSTVALLHAATTTLDPNTTTNTPRVPRC